MNNPSVIVDPLERVLEKASRLDIVVLELATAKTIFSRLPYVFWDFRVFIELIGGGERVCGPHYPPGRAWGPWCLVGPIAPL